MIDASLDAQVRRVDEDRWLASRFAPQAQRERLIALYALSFEIARTAEIVTQGLIGEIRLTWWRDAVAEVAAGKPPRAHPVVEAYAAHLRALPVEPINAMIAARGADLETAPFAAWSDLDAYLDATAGNVMRLALAACAAEADNGFVTAAARAWGCAGLLRSAPHWSARGRTFLPAGASESDLFTRASGFYAQAREHRLSSAAFPALGYVALTRFYLRAFERTRSQTMLLARQFRLIASSATGRV